MSGPYTGNDLLHVGKHSCVNKKHQNVPHTKPLQRFTYNMFLFFLFFFFFPFSLQLESKRRRHTNKSPHYQHSASRPTPLSILLRRSSVDVQMSTDRFGVSLPVLEFLHKRHHIYHIEVLKIFFVNPRQSTRHLRGSGRHVLGLDETEFPAYSQPESRSSLEEKQLGSRSDAGWGERCATSWTLYPRLLMTPS